MKLRLTSRIVLLFVLLVAVLLATVGGLSYRTASKSLQAAVVSNMLGNAIEKEAALDTWMEDRLASFEQMASEPGLVEKAANLLAAPLGSEQARSAHAILLQELGPHAVSGRSGFLELFIMELETGMVVASTRPTQEGKSELGHPYFKNGKTLFYLEGPYQSADLAAPALTAAIPLRATNGQVVAVLAARLDLTIMTFIAQRRTGLRQTEDAFFFNAEQFPVTQPRFISEPVVLRRKLDTEAVRRCVAGNSGVTLAPDYRGIPSMAVYRWNAKRQLGLIVKIDQSEALAPARAFGRSVVLISGLALLATVGLALLLARTITRPLLTLHNGVRRFAEGNFQEPLQESSGDEVGLLAGEFNQMAERVAERTAELASVNEALQAENAERKRGEESLRASQQLIEGIINAIPVRVFWKDKNLVYLGCNAVFARDAGFAEPKDLIGKDDYQMGWRDQAELYRAGDRQVIESGCPSPLVEEPQTTPEGNTITLLTSKIPLRGPKGEVSGIIGTSMDVTERKRSEESLRLQTAALEAAANAIAITDHNGTIQSVNPAFTALTGYTAQEAVGQNPRFLKGGKKDNAFYRKLWQTISSGQVWSGEMTNRRKDGRFYEEEMTITPLRNADGVVVRYIAIKQDITERKRVETELRRKEELLSESQRLGHIGSWFYDMTGSMYWSDEFYRLCGVSPDTCTPSVESLLGLMHPDDRSAMQAWIAACVAGEKPSGLEFRISLADGTSRFILGEGQAVHDAGNRLTHMAGTAQDITERKVAETELAELHKQLIAASREAGMAEIATSVLHNVGNVLNSVNVSTGLVVESVKKSRASSLTRVVKLLQEHAHDLGAFITQDSRGQHVPAHLAQLAEHLRFEQEANVRELELLRRNVDHIKEIVAMQQNYASFGGVKEMINVANLVEDSLRINEGAIIRHEVEVIREFEDVPPLNVEKHKILQILVNLLRNAKYACEDSGRTDKRLTVRVANGGGRVKISVIDNGIGIPPENLTRIFNHGFTTRKGGHGFGMHSGALAAKEMGGSLIVHSDGPGQGATFTLELPCPTPENRHE
jgi:PAS domain S-box-containing protein